MSFPHAAPSHARRQDLDWVRVIAFGLLIFYHIGMAYVPWGWHVKSPYGSAAWELPMLAVNPWRLAILFFISGVAVRFAIDKLGSGRFAASRLLRLGVPILFGMAVWVMPQAYFQLLASGEIEPGILAFWGQYLSGEQQFSITTPTWNHLWYIVYLLVYMLLTAPFAGLLRRAADSRFWNALAARPLFLIAGIAAPFILYEYLLEPRFPNTNALIGDWNNHAHRLTIFLLGFLAAKSEGFWEGVRRALPLSLILFALLFAWRMLIESTPEGGFDDIPAPVLIIGGATWPAAGVLYAWTTILSILGLAQRFLSQPSPVLKYLTGGVFCYYVLHQTIIVALIAWLGPLRLGGPLELTLVFAGTTLGCLAGYELLRRIPGLRIAFGIKER
ncbi:acyltransferase family protein [Parvularcula sp. ZS-1/3]|uniref:Acyltransferase family protein n=1 Tax=Parvularcula mediterranea TaxID=2732508 RepID=A0A7Y3RL55_9PROT|nr:acyltransferase family protein [Parvularcula mediterranea]NNU16109.1 acyltransferase family protein [Parvularcula mediterranea]